MITRSCLSRHSPEFIEGRRRKEYIADAGYDPVYGARPLKRLLQKEVETGLSRKMLAGDITDSDTVIADYLDGMLVFDKS